MEVQGKRHSTAGPRLRALTSQVLSPSGSTAPGRVGGGLGWIALVVEMKTELIAGAEARI
jgi:hypothetical protein